MKILKRKLNKNGFSHVEFFMFCLLILAVAAVGSYIYGKSDALSNSNSDLVSLVNIKLGKQVFQEKACTSSVSDGYYILSVVVSANVPVGPKTSPRYNPYVLYHINSLAPYGGAVDTWQEGRTSNLSFRMPEQLVSTTFVLGVRGLVGNTLTSAWGIPKSGDLYTPASIPLCTGNNTALSKHAVDTCNNFIPQESPNPEYPMASGSPVNFMTSYLTNLWQDYGNEIQSPGGYVAASHAVFVPGVGLEIQGYPDPTNRGLEGAGYGPGGPDREYPHGAITGSVGGSGDVDVPISGSGGFDVCFSMTPGNWQYVELAFISWPTSTASNAWNQGELDFFEGSPRSMGINLHEIGSSPKTNVVQVGWPQALADGGVHLLSARWDATDGYRFYLDGTLAHTLPLNCLPPSNPKYTQDCVAVPNTPHHLSIQMRDYKESSSSTETGTIYWTAAYNYTPQVN